MSFTNLEIQLIHKLLGGFCAQRIPDHIKDKVRLSYTIADHDVVISEERAVPSQSSDWMVLEIAKLRYVRARNEWRLYWKRASGKWWPYEPHTSSKKLEAMIKEIDADLDGCFFGGVLCRIAGGCKANFKT
jgi:hypothetical protein